MFEQKIDCSKYNPNFNLDYYESRGYRLDDEPGTLWWAGSYTVDEQDILEKEQILMGEITFLAEKQPLCEDCVHKNLNILTKCVGNYEFKKI